MSQYEFVGVDGCPGGWFSVGLDSGGNLASCGVYDTFERLLNCNADASLILVDIPIGLLDCPGGRECDAAAVDKLKPLRHSSVFRTPTRQTVREVMRHQIPTTEADRKRAFAAASKVECETAQKGLTWQSFYIARKIGEVDILLTAKTEVPRPPIREVHPEVCFWALNYRSDGSNNKHFAMRDRKKRAEGKKERLAVLKCHLTQAPSIYEALAKGFPSSQVAKDDILDALVAAVTGWLGMPDGSRLATLPEDPPKDCRGLPMEMVYCVPNARSDRG